VRASMPAREGWGGRAMRPCRQMLGPLTVEQRRDEVVPSSWRRPGWHISAAQGMSCPLWLPTLYPGVASGESPSKTGTRSSTGDARANQAGWRLQRPLTERPTRPQKSEAAKGSTTPLPWPRCYPGSSECRYLEQNPFYSYTRLQDSIRMVAAQPERTDRRPPTPDALMAGQ